MGVQIRMKEIGGQIRTFFKWIALAVLCGFVIGGVGIGFLYAIQQATQLRQESGWLVWLMPAGGLLIVFLYRICKMSDDAGTNLVLLSVRSEEKISLRMAPLIFVATVITHLVGGSAGREGAALQIGGSMGFQIGRWVRLDQNDLRIITMCGMSAAFSALFGTPVAAAVFSLEVVSVGVMYYAALVPCALASVIGYALAGWFGIHPASFSLQGIPEIGWLPLGQVVILAILCALISILFCFLLHRTEDLYKKWIQNQYLRILAGSALILFLMLVLQTRDYLGSGVDVVARALDGQARPEAFALKMIFTALTLGAGFKGGEIVPTFFVGATFGNVAGWLLGLNPSFGAGIGFCAVFCGVTNCPITSFLISVELFGMEGAVYFLIAAAVSYMLSGYSGLYGRQKILYSKFRTEFINRQAKR